jgi:hypothetical protein
VNTQYLFVLILSAVLLGWFWRKKLGPQGTLLAVVAAQFLVVLNFHTQRFNFLSMLCWGLALPVVLGIAILRRPLAARTKGIRITFAILLLGTTASDLIFNFQGSRKLYASFPNPWLLLEGSDPIAPTSQPGLRQVYEYNHNVEPNVPQAIRYASLITKKPAAFSPTAAAEAPQTFQQAKDSNRWATFLMQKPYFDLIHSSLDGKSLAEIFAINEPAFQFKRFAIPVGSQSSLATMEKLDPQALQALLKDGLFVGGSVTPGTPIFTGTILPRSALDPSAFEVTQYAPDDVTLTIDATSTGLLYWSDGYDPWWRATVDDKPTAVLRANVNFKGIAIPQGKHLVHFEYRPTAFIQALNLFFAAFGFSLLGGTITWLWRGPLPQQAGVCM